MRLLRDALRRLTDAGRQFQDAISHARAVITRKLNNERLELIGGGFIDFWSFEQPDRDTWAQNEHAIINEAAMVDNLLDAWNLSYPPDAYRPAGSCDFYSTPSELERLLCAVFSGRLIFSWERFTYTSYDNPHISKDELDELKSTLPAAVFSQEIMAQFPGRRRIFPERQGDGDYRTARSAEISMTGITWSQAWIGRYPMITRC